MRTLTATPNPSKPERVDVAGAGFDPATFVALVLDGSGTSIKIPVRRDGGFSVGQYVASTKPDGTYRLEARKHGTKTVLAQTDVVVKRAAPPPPPPPPPPPTLTYETSIPAGSTLSGIRPWLATVLTGTPIRFDFLVDGQVLWPEFFAPWGGDLDTKTLSNGVHQLTVIGHDANGPAAPGGGAVTIDNSVPPPPPTILLPYGVGLTGDTRSNQQVGGHDRGRLSYRFQSRGGNAVSVRVQQVGGAQYYAAGDGGLHRAMLFADAGGQPVGAMIAQVQWSPGNPSGKWEKADLLTFAVPGGLIAGAFYHLVFENIASDPVNNYISYNLLYTYDGFRQVGVPNLSALYAKGAGAFSLIGNHVPIFDLIYADGGHDGQSYIGILFSPGNTPSGSGVQLGDITGARQVRERFVVSGGDRPVGTVWIKVKRIGDGNSPLLLALEGGGWSESVSIPAASIAKGPYPTGQAPEAANLGGNTWVKLTPAVPRTLVNGQAYSLRMSTAPDTRYIAVPLQEGTDAPRNLRSYRFLDGGAEQSLNGGQSWAPVYYEPCDFQWYMEGAA